MRQRLSPNLNETKAVIGEKPLATLFENRTGQMVMLIATGFELDTATNDLVAIAFNTNGARFSIPREQLHCLGLPEVVGTICRRRITTDFKDWREVSLQEYLTPLGIELPASIDHLHQCFSFEIKRKTYLLPALALMRGVFFPANVLLPTMFFPNAPEAACNFGFLDGHLTAELEPSWVRRNRAFRATHLLGLLTWLYAYPSAFKMASSLHTNALRGAIGMALPNTMTTLVLHSVAVGDRQFVTKVSLLEVQPMEEPKFSLAQELTKISFHAKRNGQAATIPYLTNQFNVPLRSDNSYFISDYEWEQLSSSVLTTTKTHNQRLLLDGVLKKLVTKEPWKRIDYKVGTWTNASALLQAWSRDGRFQKLLSELARMRSLSH